MRKIKYIGFYDIESYAFEKRVRSIAAVNKMNYMASAVERAGYAVKIVSPSWSASTDGFYKKRQTQLAENVCLKIGPTFGTNNFILKKVRVLLSWFWLFFYLIRNVKKDEKVLVYHSMMAIYPIYFAKKIKNFTIILELNEIYQDVAEFSSKLKKMELQIIADSESYVLSTELLQFKIDNKKQFIINYGNYRVDENVQCQLDEKINIIYAGIIDRQKGAYNALETAQFLNSKYLIHIIGFGNNQDITDLQERIIVNNNENDCKVIYGGLKSGNNYIEYVSKCQIGLCTQSSNAQYNSTSFPSKILSYLSLGLRVVSVDIEAIKKSQIGKLLYFYQENNGKSIADAILKIDIKGTYDSKKTLRELDNKFIEDIKNQIN